MPNKRIKMVLNKDGAYTSEEGYVMKRETGIIYDKVNANNRRVLRDKTGTAIDVNEFRNDIAAWHKLELIIPPVNELK